MSTQYGQGGDGWKNPSQNQIHNVLGTHDNKNISSKNNNSTIMSIKKELTNKQRRYINDILILIYHKYKYPTVIPTPDIFSEVITIGQYENLPDTYRYILP